MAEAPQHYVGLAVFWEKQVLLQLRDDTPAIRDPGLWVFPGGKVEQGESFHAAALREFLEETGVLLPECTFRCMIKDPQNESVSSVFLWFFSAEHIVGTQYVCQEGQALKFKALEEVPELRVASYFPGLLSLLASAR